MERARVDTPLKRILAEEGRRQIWLADRVGVDARQVWQWVHGIVIPTEPNRVAVAAALGRDVADLWPAHGSEVNTSAGGSHPPVDLGQAA